MVVLLISLAEQGGSAPAIFPSPNAAWMWLQLLFLGALGLLFIGGVWYMWRLLRALERMAEGLNKER
jgi:hypothetical protein